MGGGGGTEPKQAAYDDEEEQQERMLGEPLLDDAWAAAACRDGAGIKARPKQPRSGRVRHGRGWAHTAYEEDEPLPDDVISSAVTGRFVISPRSARRLFATSRSATSASCAACGHANTTPVGQSIVLYCYHQLATQKGKETQIMT